MSHVQIVQTSVHATGDPVFRLSDRSHSRQASRHLWREITEYTEQQVATTSHGPIDSSGRGPARGRNPPSHPATLQRNSDHTTLPAYLPSIPNVPCHTFYAWLVYDEVFLSRNPYGRTF